MTSIWLGEKEVRTEALTITNSYWYYLLVCDSMGALSEEEKRMNYERGDVLTIEELSAYLKIPKSTLYKLTREGKIPCKKIGRHWRFHKNAIDTWRKEHRDTTIGDDSELPKVSVNRG